MVLIRPKDILRRHSHRVLVIEAIRSVIDGAKEAALARAGDDDRSLMDRVRD